LFLGLSFFATAEAAEKSARPGSEAQQSKPATNLPPISYSRDIRPIFADSCFTCHGADAGQRQADLRLDVRAIAVKDVIVPGKAAESPLLHRIASSDPDEQMPPASKKPRLTPAAVAKIRRWIDEGAKYETHWAYTPPQRPQAPEIPRNYAANWARNPIDHFIAAGHAQQNLLPSPDADPPTLLRRLHFDLTGLPPSWEETDAFLADRSPAAYEQTVDRLFASPQFGERMAMYWLDVVRYADSGGYHSDNERSVWLFRDYVIDAFNKNKPFDHFTEEQLAGDLLPCASREQKIASGYNRLLQTTEEGGAQAKEYTAKYAADRVRNTAYAWLGSTMACAQCHDHKYDPFTMKDFYSLGAFFADVREEPISRQQQTPMPTPQQEARLKRLDGELAVAEKVLAQREAILAASQSQWETWIQSLPHLPSSLPKAVAAALSVEAAKRTPQQKQHVRDYYRDALPKKGPAERKVEELKQQKDQLQAEIPTTLITQAVAPRPMRILPRGNWQDDSGPAVEPAIPEFLGKINVKRGRATRLDLAHWMVSRENPLVARVLVNRIWKLLFGQGLVRTCDDLGTQGALPSHPALLDWLAVELMDSGWNVKHVMKLIVMSRTYQQSSRGSPDLDRRDPTNTWLARQGRFRLDAEIVRDNALAISGLLSSRIGGPTVKPYQPPGYWDYLNFPQRQWQDDHGENQYRRGLYTFWQRTFLHPSLLAFDAPTREECTVDRARSNTPLQALVLLNDPAYVEASKVFAGRIVAEGGRTQSERLRYAYRRAIQREPTPPEADLLMRLYREHLTQYQADRAAAVELLKVGDAQPPGGAPPAELAAWTSVARAVLNLHETITRD
jgi:mono/diheme cytochrome c family protein